MKTLRFHFFQRKDRTNKNNEHPIFANVTVDKKMPISTGLFVEESKWDQPKQKIKGNTPIAKALNERLEMFKAGMFRNFNLLVSEDKDFTTKALLDKFRGKSKNIHTFVEAMECVVNFQKELYDAGDLSKTTYDKYKNSKKLLIAFLKKRIQNVSIRLDELQPYIIKEFDLYLGSEGYKAGYINKVIQQVRSSISYGMERGWLPLDPFISHKYRPVPVKIDYLLPEELKVIEQTPIPNESLSKIKDRFLMICYTGLNYSDLMELNYDQILVNKSGNKYILKESRVKLKGKRGKPYNIPLVEEAINLLNKYKDYPELEGSNKCIPEISNPNFNLELKTLGNLMGIKRIKLTTNIGRKTFGTIMLNAGVSMETVSHMMGHKSIKTTQRYYAEILKGRVFEEMEEMAANKIKKAEKEKQGKLPA